MTAPKPKHGIRAVPVKARLRGPFIKGGVLLVVAGAAILFTKLEMSPILSSFLERASTSPSAALTLLFLYTALLAMPFVPGVEIGLALLIAFGAAMAGPVYMASILALSIAFVAGRLAARSATPSSSGTLLPASNTLEVLSEGLRGRIWFHKLTRFRWLAVIVLINMPGNSVIGGGGGIAMAIGYSRSFTFIAFVACAAVAVAPVPALVLLAEVTGFGERLGQWFGHLI